jgi:hypothetical protein
MSPGAHQISLAVLVAIWSLAWLESRADWRRYLAEWRSDDFVDPRAVATGSFGPIGSMGPEGEQEPEKEEPECLSDRLFHDAQQQYLAGDWARCEQLLRHLLKLDNRDVEARLLLATLWRHLGRTEEAVRQLHRLERLEAAAPWNYEIACELDEIARQSDLSSEEGTSYKISTLTNSEATTSVTIEELPAQDEQQLQTDDLSTRVA